MTDARSVEEILTGIADELKPDADRLVAELGREKVLENIASGLDRLETMRVKRIHERLTFIKSSPDEARQAIKSVLEVYPGYERFVYVGLADKAFRLLIAEYTDEVRDWHCLVRAAQAAIGERDAVTVERLNVLADLLRAAIAKAEIDRSYARFASGTEARRAATVKQGAVHDGPTAESGDAHKGDA